VVSPGRFEQGQHRRQRLVRDGATAALLRCNGTGPAVIAAGEHTWPNSLGVMGWDIAEDGLKAIFSRDIPGSSKTNWVG